MQVLSLVKQLPLLEEALSFGVRIQIQIHAGNQNFIVITHEFNINKCWLHNIMIGMLSIQSSSQVPIEESFLIYFLIPVLILDTREQRFLPASVVVIDVPKVRPFIFNLEKLNSDVIFIIEE